MRCAGGSLYLVVGQGSLGSVRVLRPVPLELEPLMTSRPFLPFDFGSVCLHGGTPQATAGHVQEVQSKLHCIIQPVCDHFQQTVWL